MTNSTTNDVQEFSDLIANLVDQYPYTLIPNNLKTLSFYGAMGEFNRNKKMSKCFYYVIDTVANYLATRLFNIRHGSRRSHLPMNHPVIEMLKLYENTPFGQEVTRFVLSGLHVDTSKHSSVFDDSIECTDKIFDFVDEIAFQVINDLKDKSTVEFASTERYLQNAAIRSNPFHWMVSSIIRSQTVSKDLSGFSGWKLSQQVLRRLK